MRPPPNQASALENHMPRIHSENWIRWDEAQVLLGGRLVRPLAEGRHFGAYSVSFG